MLFRSRRGPVHVTVFHCFRHSSPSPDKGFILCIDYNYSFIQKKILTAIALIGEWHARLSTLGSY